jgi:hypothetical protein
MGIIDADAKVRSARNASNPPIFECRAPVYHNAHIQEHSIQRYADKKPTLLTGYVDQVL